MLTPAYLDPSLDIDSRVNDLLGRMTLEEKLREIVMLGAMSVVEGDTFSHTLALQELGNMGCGAMEAPRLSPEKNASIINSIQEYCLKETRLGIPVANISGVILLLMKQWRPFVGFCVPSPF